MPVAKPSSVPRFASLIAWQASHYYTVGERVTNDSGKIYQCSTAGTTAGSGGPTGTGGSITDGSAVWAYQGATAPAWISSTAYSVGDTVTNGGNVYVCIAAGTSAGSGGPTGNGATGIVDGTVTWQFTAAATAITTQPPAGIADHGWLPGQRPPAQYWNWLWFQVYLWLLWLQDITNQALTWTAAHTFQKGLTATQSTANTNGITSTGNGQGVGVAGVGGTANGVGLSGTGGTAPAWQASHAYSVGDGVNHDSGKVYRCTTAGTSASSGGPTGTGGSISDGSVVWAYQAPAISSQGVRGQGTGTGAGGSFVGGSSNGNGVQGSAVGTGTGVVGVADTAGIGVMGTGGTASGAGVSGFASAGSSANGVEGYGDGSGNGVFGSSPNNASSAGVHGRGYSGGNGIGVKGTGAGAGPGGKFVGGTVSPAVQVNPLSGSDWQQFLATDLAGNNRFQVDHNGYPGGLLAYFTEEWRAAENISSSGTSTIFKNWKFHLFGGGAGSTVTNPPTATINSRYALLAVTSALTNGDGAAYLCEQSFLLTADTALAIDFDVSITTRTGSLEIDVGLTNDSNGDPNSGSGGVSGAWFSFSGAHGDWRYNVLNSTPASVLDQGTGISGDVGTNTFHRFRIELHGINTPLGQAVGGGASYLVRFFVDGTLNGEVTTTYPDGSQSFTMIAKRNGGSSGGASVIVGPIRATWNRKLAWSGLY